MKKSWMDNVVAVTGKVIQVAGPEGVAGLICWRNSAASLRIIEESVRSNDDIDLLEALARKHAVNRIETQGSFVTKGLASQILIERGFFEIGHSTINFMVDVATALQRLENLKQRLDNRAPKIVVPTANHMTQIAHIIDNELLLDDFELQARLAHNGPDTINISECSVMDDSDGLAGFILISEVKNLTERELIVRWVAPRHRGKAVVNFALMLEALDRAAAAKVKIAYFTANPLRHKETLRLATAIQAEFCGESVALALNLD